MNDESYYDARDDRLMRYPEARRLDQTRWIALRLSPDYALTYAGQAAALVAANLLARMSRAVALDVPDVSIIAPLPFAGCDLGDYALAQMLASDPHGAFCRRSVAGGDYVIHLGASGAPVVTHGAGWFSYVGRGPSPVAERRDANPVGAAFAAVTAAARLAVHGFEPPPATLAFNTLHWTHDITDRALPALPPETTLGNIWTVGTGSVGTAVLYFLTLATRQFAATLFDGDRVKLENITRSPIFVDRDKKDYKVNVTAAYLKAVGVSDVTAEPVHLHKSRVWNARREGIPDLMVSAANEDNVRYVVESLLPPVQIYGTTGANWQAAMIRHIPMQEGCSCCVFPEGRHTPTACATDPEPARSPDQQIDASLPFLSFGAGLMAAAEILKLGLPGYPFTRNRAFFQSRPEPRLVVVGAPQRKECMCRSRSRAAHTRMIAGSRYAGLSHGHTS